MIQIHRNKRQMLYFDILASLCNMAGWFKSDLVSNPEDKFSRDAVHEPRREKICLWDFRPS